MSLGKARNEEATQDRLVTKDENHYNQTKEQ